jgi:hypothetical protein
VIRGPEHWPMPKGETMERVIRNVAKMGSSLHLHASKAHTFRDLTLIVGTLLLVAAFVQAIRP